jgi:hypothetical protein
MPAPTNERQSLERELREELLPAQLAAYQQELAGGQADKVRREWLEWHIRRVQKRMAHVEAQLAGSGPVEEFNPTESLVHGYLRDNPRKVLCADCLARELDLQPASAVEPILAALEERQPPFAGGVLWLRPARGSCSGTGTKVTRLSGKARSLARAPLPKYVSTLIATHLVQVPTLPWEGKNCRRYAIRSHHVDSQLSDNIKVQCWHMKCLSLPH